VLIPVPAARIGAGTPAVITASIVADIILTVVTNIIAPHVTGDT